MTVFTHLSHQKTVFCKLQYGLGHNVRTHDGNDNPCWADAIVNAFQEFPAGSNIGCDDGATACHGFEHC